MEKRRGRKGEVKGDLWQKSNKERRANGEGKEIDENEGSIVRFMIHSEIFH